MSHTPGPWKMGDANYLTIVGPNTRFYTGPNGRRLACVATVDISDNDAEDAANARLIAAAPELLEACEHIADYAEELGRAGLLPLALQCKAAIAKAKGDE